MIALRHMPMAPDRVGVLHDPNRNGKYRNLSAVCNRCGVRKEIRQRVKFFICGDCKLVDQWYVKMTQTEEALCPA